ncbi:MAG: HlyD family efflux transporter periplasmic adaptor subunit [Coprothermobacterota bacterium]|nr:HlyD family efflux transporter periplasmic adaptor subunit [Coprothermobacterota bacterium]
MKGKVIYFLVLALTLTTLTPFISACSNAKELCFWGTIEAEEVRVISESTGRITSMNFKEGDQVQSGQALCSIEDVTLIWKMEEAKQAMYQAQAQLKKAENGATAEEIAIAEANLEYVQALLDGAEQAYSLAQEIYDFEAPRELKLAQAQNQYDLAVINFDDAQKKLEQAKKLGKSLPLLQAEAELEQAKLNFLKAEQAYKAATATPTSPELIAAKAALEEAKARRTACEAQLRMAQTSNGNPDILQAQAAYDACEIKLEEAKTLRDYAQRSGNPVQIDQAEYQVKLAEIELREAQRKLELAQAEGEDYFLKKAEAEYEAACAALEQAQATYDALVAKGYGAHIQEAQQAYQTASKALSLAQANYTIALGQADPLELAYLSAKENLETAQKLLEETKKVVEFKAEERAQLDKARADRDSLRAKLKEAQESLKKIKEGALPEDIDSLRATVAQTEAAFNLAQELVQKCVIKAPITGVVLEKYANTGDTVNAGSAICSLADLDNLYVKIYLSETEVGKVHLNQEVKVKVDAYPEKEFAGKVVYISPKAQFTPKNVQTIEQRTFLTFAVKVLISDPEHLLKIGIPADVYLPNSD